MAKQPKPRRKLTHACDNCRSKKVRCDGQYPRCKYCADRELSCTYLTATKRRGPRNPYIEELEAKVKALEEKVQQLNIELPSGIFVSQQNPEGEPDFRPDQGGVIISEETAAENPMLPTSNDPINSLPPQEEIDQLIDLYFSHVHPSIRFVHRPSFLSRLHSKKQCLLLLNSIFAVSARFAPHVGQTKPRYQWGDVYFKRANSHITKEALSQPTIEIVQSLILLGLYEYGKMKGFSSWNYVGIAIRLAQQLGLHTIDSYHNRGDNYLLKNTAEDWLVTESKRRTWWGCFIADRFASGIVGRSMYIDERDCLVTMPSADAQWDDQFGVLSKLPPESPEELLNFGSDLTGRSGVFCNLSAHFMSLIDLKGQVTRYLLHRTSKGPTYDPDHTELMRLDTAIFQWQNDLPSKFRNPQDLLRLETEEISDLFRTVACLHGFFHGTIITLHRGNLAQAQLNQNYSMAMFSKRRCVAAANSITQLVRDAWTRLSDLADPFYPYSVFNAATIHANCAFLESGTTAAHSRAELEMATRALVLLSEYWLMSNVYLVMLQTLQNSLSFSIVLGTHTNWEVPFSASYFDWYYTVQNPPNMPIPMGTPQQGPIPLIMGGPGIPPPLSLDPVDEIPSSSTLPSISFNNPSDIGNSATTSFNLPETSNAPFYIRKTN
ncbi:hypothetical protein CONCODRAFT_77620 [Conidiobolus coronatus NRRL 28638]|uniref:Zn(2)-C6 fungal-type domain-containing protein n=1 Tax=Conidiobolus coronatus (strain ATCC 28846 / CBS 209.66 / NRRL 28638) TaxID=796925 RepID=A0A137PD05_CONC2|nr:hypothetical protein CONCODRAFT_77620 [Conidiobolus coronatus NRRL 28638]|eukprot:KXN72821.1 hypothetical protein CONCODRAFT_77620 [Conidiobolus coronatus NRRL 28638]